MKEVRKINDFGYVVKRSDRKSIGITIERDGSVTVRSPFFVPADEINRFVSNKRIWIQQKLSKKRCCAEKSQGVSSSTARDFCISGGAIACGMSMEIVHQCLLKGDKV